MLLPVAPTVLAAAVAAGLAAADMAQLPNSGSFSVNQVLRTLHPYPKQGLSPSLMMVDDYAKHSATGGIPGFVKWAAARNRFRLDKGSFARTQPLARFVVGEKGSELNLDIETDSSDTWVYSHEIRSTAEYKSNREKFVGHHYYEHDPKESGAISDPREWDIDVKPFADEGNLLPTVLKAVSTPSEAKIVVQGTGGDGITFKDSIINVTTSVPAQFAARMKKDGGFSLSPNQMSRLFKSGLLKLRKKYVAFALKKEFSGTYHWGKLDVPSYAESRIMWQRADTARNKWVISAENYTYQRYPYKNKWDAEIAEEFALSSTSEFNYMSRKFVRKWYASMGRIPEGSPEGGKGPFVARYDHEIPGWWFPCKYEHLVPGLTYEIGKNIVHIPPHIMRFGRITEDQKIETNTEDQKIETNTEDQKIETNTEDQKIETNTEDQKIETNTEDQKKCMARLQYNRHMPYSLLGKPLHWAANVAYSVENDEFRVSVHQRKGILPGRAGSAVACRDDAGEDCAYEGEQGKAVVTSREESL